MIRHKEFSMCEKVSTGVNWFGYEGWQCVYANRNQLFDAAAKFANECGDRLVSINTVRTHYTNWDENMVWSVVVWYKEQEAQQ